MIFQLFLLNKTLDTIEKYDAKLVLIFKYFKINLRKNLFDL